MISDRRIGQSTSRKAGANPRMNRRKGVVNPVKLEGREVVIDENVLGSGGFATVFEARDSTGSRLAAKVVDIRSTSEWALQKLVHEAEALRAAQTHAHVVKFYGDIRHGPNHHVFVFERCGPDCLSLVLEERGLGEDRAKLVIMQLLEALAWLHAMNICHGCTPPPPPRARAPRPTFASPPPHAPPPSNAPPLHHSHPTRVARSDVKPENLLCGLDGGLGDIKLADFGSAMRLPASGSAPVDTVAQGTTLYSPPEVLQGMVFTTAADIWAAGITAYVLVSGYFPFGCAADALTHSAAFDAAAWRQKSSSRQVRGFISGALRHKPPSRPTAREAARHEWFRQTCETPPPRHAPLALLRIPSEGGASSLPPPPPPAATPIKLTPKNGWKRRREGYEEREGQAEPAAGAKRPAPAAGAAKDAATAASSPSSSPTSIPSSPSSPFLTPCPFVLEVGAASLEAVASLHSRGWSLNPEW